MSWMICAVFLLTDLIMVLVSGFAYGKKDRYQEGTIFGVHVPKEALEDPGVRKLVRSFSKGWRILQTAGLLAGIAVCFLSFLDFAAFILVWCVWFFCYIAGLYYLIYHTHRKMYRIKIERGWIRQSSARIVRIDTDVSAMSNRMPISWKWNLPALGFLAASGLFLFREKGGSGAGEGLFDGIFSGDKMGFFLIFLIGVVEFLSLLAFHVWIGRRPNVVYSQKSEINFALNRMTKRAWTKGLTISALIISADTAYLTVRLAIGDWLSDVDFFLYTFFQMTAVVVLLLPVVFIRRKRREVLSAEEELFQVDDDEYWKNGWYYNPNDPRLFVQDRMSDMNFSMNMARPAAKAICSVTAAVTIAVLVFAAVMVMRFETAEVRFIRDGGQIEISAAGYECDFQLSEVKAAELLDAMPEERFRRINGGSTDHYDIGYYNGSETGKCMMFLYAGYEPVLKIRLENQTVFVNSKQAGQTEMWFESLAAESS